MLKHIYFFTFLFLSTAIIAQDGNVTDANGKKQGAWSKLHESTKKPFYKGQFKDDVRIGEWIYFYADGAKKASVIFSAQGTACHSTLFDEKAEKMAFGKYIKEEKDSTWTFYFSNGEVASREEWSKGVRHGREESYFVTGGIVETLNWDQGKKNGPFKEYHKKDVLSREGEYLQDEYEGQMIFYFDNGKKEIEGKYVNGLKESTWRYYNKDGSIHYQVVFRAGTMVKEKKENGLFKEMNPDGSLVSEITYEKGIKEGEFRFYHPAGEPVMEQVTDDMTGESYWKQVPTGNMVKLEGKFKNGQYHGELKHYNEIGKLIRTEKYIEGVLQ